MTKFELHIDQQDASVQSGTVPVRWCLDPRLFRKYTSAQIKDMKVLIVVIPKRGSTGKVRSEQRKLVSVLDLMTYVEFRKDGTNHIFGFVLTPYLGVTSGTPNGEKINLQRKFMGRSEGRWDTDVIWEDNEEQFVASDRVRSFLALEQKAHITVEVPEECFAPPPPEWEQNFVNALFRDPAIDQCDYRRRRMLAYPLALVYVPLITLIRVIVYIGGLGLGLRKLDHEPILSPYALTTDVIWINVEESIFFPKQKIFLVQFSPLIVGLVSFGMWKVLDVSVLPAIGWALAALVGGTLLVLVSIFGSGFFQQLRSDYDKYMAERKGVVRNNEQEQARLDALRDVLTCSNGPVGTGLDSIPFKYRSFRLRFYDLKAKVCRPFAKG